MFDQSPELEEEQLVVENVTVVEKFLRADVPTLSYFAVVVYDSDIRTWVSGFRHLAR